MGPEVILRSGAARAGLRETEAWAEDLRAAIPGPSWQQWEVPGPHCLGRPSPAPCSASSFNQKADPHSWSVQGGGEPGQNPQKKDAEEPGEGPGEPGEHGPGTGCKWKPSSPPSLPEARKPRCGLAVVEKETPPKRETSRLFLNNHLLFLMILAWPIPPGQRIFVRSVGHWLAQEGLGWMAQLCSAWFLVPREAGSGRLSRQWQGPKRTRFQATDCTSSLLSHRPKRVQDPRVFIGISLIPALKAIDFSQSKARKNSAPAP